MNAWPHLFLLILTPFLVTFAMAELPCFEKGDFRGCFAAHEASRYDFVMKECGEMRLIPKRRSREPAAIAKRIRIEYGIEELQPDGTAVFKQTRDGSLTSDEEPSDDFDRMTFRGTTTGEAVYEVILEQSRDVISIGGRVVDSGELTEKPTRFALRVVVPNVYRDFEFKAGEGLRAYERKTRSDYLRLLRIDYSKLKLDNDDVKAVDGPALTGSGIEEIETRLSYYEGRRFFFMADRKSGMAISQGRSAGPWFEGFTVHWFADAAKDPEGEARLNLSIR